MKKVCLTIIFIGLFFPIQCNKPSDNNDNTEEKEKKGSIIVTVDGLSFVNTLLSSFGLNNIQNTDDYLESNLIGLINPETIRSFTWNGDAEETSTILQSSDTGIRKFLFDNYNEAKAENKAFIVISHSWGTFLSYLALSLEPQIECDLFITLSSPLGTTSGLTASEDAVRSYTDDKLDEMSFDIQGTNYPNVNVFYNFWANGDIISGILTGKVSAAINIQDIKVDEGINNQRDLLGCYFWHNFSTMGDEVITDLSHTFYLVYLASIGVPDITPTRDAFLNQIISPIQTAVSGCKDNNQPKN